MPSKREFEKFYLANFDKIYRFVIFRVGHNKELAEDLVSEIFMKALGGFDSYDPKISASAWVFTIAKNHLANYWRDLKPMNQLPDEEEGIGLDKKWLDLAKKEAEKSQEILEIYDLLEKLSPEEQEIVTFHYLFGYSYLEVAKMRGMTEGAVKVAAHRAVDKLRKNI